jgi:hypothetical protein
LVRRVGLWIVIRTNGAVRAFHDSDRWSLQDYQTAPFVKKVGNKSLTVNHNWDVSISDVPIDYARWFVVVAAH